MSAEEKILQGILDDAAVQAEKIMADAKEQCDRLLEDARLRSKEYSAKTVSDALRRAKAIKQNAQSGAELTVRDAKLAKKHEEIEKTVAAAVERILALPDGEYFALLAKLVAKNAQKPGGVLLPGVNDAKRDLSVFERLLKEGGTEVTVGKASPDVKNGFILKYGDVEYNLSLSAVIDDKKDILEDRINSILFTE